MKKETNLEGTKVLAAVREMLEDRTADAIAHMQEPTVVEGKPCKITITVLLSPIGRGRQEFSAEVASSMSLAPRESAASTIYAHTDKDGNIEVGEYNPQLNMFQQ